MNAIYKCPVCANKLTKTDHAFTCGLNHSYDISKEGYVNLLLANQKKSKDPGDTKAMIENRKYFLEQGYYDALSEKLNEIIVGCVAKSPAPINILDLGCGEGFYSAKLQASLNTKQQELIQLHGVDISKAAVQKAAGRKAIAYRGTPAGSGKRNPGIQFCIASNFHLPYLNESMDLIFSIFSPFDHLELMRVLKPGGKIIVVRPGPTHLKELASLLYEKFELQGDSSNLSANLPPLQAFEVKYQIHLKNNRDIQSLIGMTPYFWTLNEEKKLLLAQQQKLTATADFRISLFQK